MYMSCEHVKTILGENINERECQCQAFNMFRILWFDHVQDTRDILLIALHRRSLFYDSREINDIISD